MYNNFMKKNWVNIVSMIISGALLITGIVFLFVINYNMSVPADVEIFASDNTTYLKTSLNNNEYGYIYKFYVSVKSMIFQFVIKTNMKMVIQSFQSLFLGLQVFI